MVSLVFDSRALDEKLLVKQQPAALCHWLIDIDKGLCMWGGETTQWAITG